MDVDMSPWRMTLNIIPSSLWLFQCWSLKTVRVYLNHTDLVSGEAGPRDSSSEFWSMVALRSLLGHRTLTFISRHHGNRPDCCATVTLVWFHCLCFVHSDLMLLHTGPAVCLLNPAAHPLTTHGPATSLL